MTEQLKEAPISPISNAPDTDWYLQFVVELANRIAIPMHLTLNVGGNIISGELVGGRIYSEGVKALWMNGEKIESDELNGSFKQLEDFYTFDEEAETKRQPPQFIHLRNARVYTAGQAPIPANEGVWWRGRITAVDGFWFGRLSTEHRS